ncbi:MAG: CpaF family protein [Eubacterium sp.]|nr:CpaF family protein [Eubacterium sp.]
MNGLQTRIHDAVMGRLDFSREVPDSEVLDLIDEELLGAAREGTVTLEQMKSLRQDVFYSIRKLDVLQDMIDDAGITEIMVNGPDRIFIERNGQAMPAGVHFSSEKKLLDVIQVIVSKCDREVNASSPIVDARLENGDRVSVVLQPVALNGPILTIRRFPSKPITMEDLISFGSVSREAAEFLRTLVRAGYNIFISGGTGCGKTTFLNALSDYIPTSERVITIEDNAELQIRHIPNLVRLEARNANTAGCQQVTIRDLIKASLRMRPDRIIVGEVRGGEAIDMIQAMNTGHDGSMSTGHANSTTDMLARLETMTLMGIDLPIPAIRGQLASGIDVIVHLGRMRDRSRKLLEIAETGPVTPSGVSLRTLYRFQETGEKDGKITGEWIRVNELEKIGKLRMAGQVKKAG